MADNTTQGARSNVLTTASSLIELSIQLRPEGLASTMMIAFSSLSPEDLETIAKRNVQILQELAQKAKTSS